MPYDVKHWHNTYGCLAAETERSAWRKVRLNISIDNHVVHWRKAFWAHLSAPVQSTGRLRWARPVDLTAVAAGVGAVADAAVGWAGAWVGDDFVIFEAWQSAVCPCWCATCDVPSRPVPLGYAGDDLSFQWWRRRRRLHCTVVCMCVCVCA